MQQAPPDSFIVSIIKEPEPQVTVADVIVGSLGIAGALLLLAIVLGGVTGAGLVLWRRWRPREWRPMPPVSPSWMDERPPSSRAR